MAEKTIPDLPFVLATTEGDMGTYSLEVRAVEERGVNLIYRSPIGVHQYKAAWDPAELVRNLAAFVPEVEPVAWINEFGTILDSKPSDADKRGLVRLYAHPPVTAEPATAPSVADASVDTSDATVSAPSVERCRRSRRSPDGTPGDAGEHGSDVVDRTEYERMVERVLKAEARVRELEDYRRGSDIDFASLQEHAESLTAEVERYKVALEAAEEHTAAIEEHWQAVAGRDIAMKQVQQAYDTRNAARTRAVAARAAVEAETSEEAGDE